MYIFLIASAVIHCLFGKIGDNCIAGAALLKSIMKLVYRIYEISGSIVTIIKDSLNLVLILNTFQQSTGCFADGDTNCGQCDIFNGKSHDITTEPVHGGIAFAECYIVRPEKYGNNQTEIAENRHIFCKFRIKIHTTDGKGKNVSDVNTDIRIASHQCNHKRK